MDLVDEQHVALAEPGEDGGQVAGPFERRARGDVQADLELGRHDAGERGLAQARRTGEEQVVDRLCPPAGGLEDDAEVLLELALADEVVEQARAEPALLTDEIRPRRLSGGPGRERRLEVVGCRLGREDLVACHQAAASFCSANRSSSEESASSGSSRTASATSSGP